MHYPPLDAEFIKERVVIPALTQSLEVRGRQLSAERAKALAASAATAIITLQDQLKGMVPKRVFTPRDLTDACAWIDWRLHFSRQPISEKLLNGLIWKAFDDVIGHEITESLKDRYQVLQLWFTARFPQESDSGATDRLSWLSHLFQFNTSIEQPGFECSSPAVQHLVKALAQDLDRCLQECQTGKRHSGRRATLLEGPAGRGKDATLHLLLDMWIKNAAMNGWKVPVVRFLNAGDCSWSELKSAIRRAQAMEEIMGEILVISEPNLIAGADLEGELNDVLTKPCAVGFHLFATINPPQYSGRCAFSPALKDRFRILTIGDYNFLELNRIAALSLPAKANCEIAETLTKLHDHVGNRLQRLNRPLQPTCKDLQRLAARMTEPEKLLEMFTHHYWLFLTAANIDQSELQRVLEETPGVKAADHRSVFVDIELCRWLFRLIPKLDRPVIINRGYPENWCSTPSEVCLVAGLSQEQAKKEVIRQLARLHWERKTEMPLTLPDIQDSQACHLYRRMQHNWFNKHYPNMGVSPEAVFAAEEKPDKKDFFSPDVLKAIDCLQAQADPPTSMQTLWQQILSVVCSLGVDSVASKKPFQKTVLYLAKPVSQAVRWIPIRTMKISLRDRRKS